MKEIKLIQRDDGTFTIESTDAEGKAMKAMAENAASAIEQLQADFLGKANTAIQEAREEQEMGPARPKGMLEENLAPIAPVKKGANAKKQADWTDYGGM